jgi:fructokinase
MLLRPQEIDGDYVRAAKILHYGSISLIGDPSRSATLAAVQAAMEGDTLISYDPNLRMALWPSAEAARQGMLDGWRHAQIGKVSRDELHFLSGEGDLGPAIDALWHERLRLLVITEGSKGCRYATPSARGRVPGFAVQPVDTTGAGDGFVAGLLAGLIDTPRLWEHTSGLEQALRFANAVGALTTTQRGAIPALPTREQVEALLAA